MLSCKDCKYMSGNPNFCRYGVPDKKQVMDWNAGQTKEVYTNVFDCTSISKMREPEGKCGPERKLYEFQKTFWTWLAGRTSEGE